MSRSESTYQRDVLTKVLEITMRCLKGPSRTSSFLPLSVMRKKSLGFLLVLITGLLCFMQLQFLTQWRPSYCSISNHFLNQLLSDFEGSSIPSLEVCSLNLRTTTVFISCRDEELKLLDEKHDFKRAVHCQSVMGCYMFVFDLDILPPCKLLQDACWK